MRGLCSAASLLNMIDASQYTLQCHYLGSEFSLLYVCSPWTISDIIDCCRRCFGIDGLALFTPASGKHFFLENLGFCSSWAKWGKIIHSVYKMQPSSFVVSNASPKFSSCCKILPRREPDVEGKICSVMKIALKFVMRASSLKIYNQDKWKLIFSNMSYYFLSYLVLPTTLNCDCVRLFCSDLFTFRLQQMGT